MVMAVVNWVEEFLNVFVDQDTLSDPTATVNLVSYLSDALCLYLPVPILPQQHVNWMDVQEEEHAELILPPPHVNVNPIIMVLIVQLVRFHSLLHEFARPTYQQI